MVNNDHLYRKVAFQKSGPSNFSTIKRHRVGKLAQVGDYKKVQALRCSALPLGSRKVFTRLVVNCRQPSILRNLTLRMRTISTSRRLMTLKWRMKPIKPVLVQLACLPAPINRKSRFWEASSRNSSKSNRYSKLVIDKNQHLVDPPKKLKKSVSTLNLVLQKELV